MSDLTESELNSLNEIIKNERVKLALPTEHLEKLIKLGYAELHKHGVIATGKGRMKSKLAETES
ncbi:MAG: hypothetical protein MI741_14680 [Rhodospirillales bacterium]|nr:hypothetical protein [Rhodospirillales bacterium]